MKRVFRTLRTVLGGVVAAHILTACEGPAGEEAVAAASEPGVAGLSAAKPAALRITTPARTILAGDCSAGITVQRVNSGGNATGPGIATAVNLASAGAVTFYSDPLCKSPVTALSIPASRSDATFYFSGTVAASSVITASSTGLTSASQTEVIRSAAAARVAFVAGPSGTKASGATIAPAMDVRVQDRFGNLAEQATSPITLSIAAGSASGQLSGTLVKNAVAGRALFDNVKVTTSTGGSFRLQASSPGLSSALSGAFTVTAGTAPSPTPTATASPSPTVSPTPAPTATVSPRPSPSPTPTPTPTATSTPMPTATATPTPTAAPTSGPMLPESSFSQIYEVGPGKPYADPSAVPWESLQRGTLVKIHYRAEPYANKWVIAAQGTADQPVVVRGIPSSTGALPVITGNGAKTRLELDYWNEVRSVIKFGGGNRPAGNPSYVTLENLEIRSAHPSYTFTDHSGGSQVYSSNAASVHIETGSHITIRNCILRDSGNGLFSGAASDVLIEGNYIYGNGIVGSVYQHNSYTGSHRITFQYNHYGPLRAGAPGNSLKDRSAGMVVRYNWMDGGNRPLDLVESDSAPLLSDPAYGESWVYGNVLIKNDVSENSQVVHYGGDGADPAHYRKGTLWFYNNTVVSYRSGNTTLFGLSSNDESVQAFNNIVHAVAGGAKLAISDTAGRFNLHHNWLTTGWRQSFSTFQGSASITNILTGTVAPLTNLATRDYSLLSGSAARGAGVPVTGLVPPGYLPTEEYVVHQSHRPRAASTSVDLGAFAGK